MMTGKYAELEPGKESGWPEKEIRLDGSQGRNKKVEQKAV